MAVGSQAVQFPVHESLLCKHSKVSGRALQGGCAQGKGKTFALAEETVADFSVFVDWMCTGNLTVDQEIYEEYLVQTLANNYTQSEDGAEMDDGEYVEVEGGEDVRMADERSDSDSSEDASSTVSPNIRFGRRQRKEHRA